ncbi:MAG: AraC family transcriptional regulator [Lachnospiraceae bacterium]|nr:AraC family transcriptional regulator [Lachnospiraceae bacterium]
MNNFSRISEALKYIDGHLDETITLEGLAEKFFLSPFYFHKLFSMVVGKSLAAYIRDRRVLSACRQLCDTKKTILDIALDCGFRSPAAFSRTFRQVQGMSPSEYRAQGCRPVIVTAGELIMKFTNRLRGGILLNPNIIKRGKMIIAGTCGDGDKTEEVWSAFGKLSGEKPLGNALSGDGYEIRVCADGKCTVYAGYCVSDKDNIDPAYSVIELPASKYASFDVYISGGYESENSAMEEWLKTNEEGYLERLMDENTHYCVEHFDERFSGSGAESVVEIWIPVYVPKAGDA